MDKILFLFIIASFLSCNNSKKNETKENDSENIKIIQSDEINKKIESGSDILIENSAIVGDIDFTRSADNFIESEQTKKYIVHSSVVFRNCTFKGKIIAAKQHKNYSSLTNFRKNLSFSDCTFQDSIIISNSQIDGYVNFRKCIFQEFCDFRSTVFNFKKNYFVNCKFIKTAKFNLVDFKGDASFFQTRFKEKVFFQLSRFRGDAQFSDVEFSQNLDFTVSKFMGTCVFNYTKFYKKVDFNDSKFYGRTEFQNSEFNFLSYFDNIIFFSSVKYNNSIMKGVITFKNTHFYYDKPDFTDAKIEDGTEIVSKNSVFLQKSEFIYNKE